MMAAKTKPLRWFFSPFLNGKCAGHSFAKKLILFHHSVRLRCSTQESMVQIRCGSWHWCRTGGKEVLCEWWDQNCPTAGHLTTAPKYVQTDANSACCPSRLPCSAALKGTMICRGKLILMADADGATKFSDLEKAEAALCDLSPKPVWKGGVPFSHT